MGELTTMGDLESYVDECERKIEALEKRLVRVEAQVASAILVAAREATESVVARLRHALEEE